MHVKRAPGELHTTFSQSARMSTGTVSGVCAMKWSARLATIQPPV
jgi:hypothetical protein